MSEVYIKDGPLVDAPVRFGSGARLTNSVLLRAAALAWPRNQISRVRSIIRRNVASVRCRFWLSVNALATKARLLCVKAELRAFTWAKAAAVCVDQMNEYGARQNVDAQRIYNSLAAGGWHLSTKSAFEPSARGLMVDGVEVERG